MMVVLFASVSILILITQTLPGMYLPLPLGILYLNQNVPLLIIS